MATSPDSAGLSRSCKHRLAGAGLGRRDKLIKGGGAEDIQVPGVGVPGVLESLAAIRKVREVTCHPSRAPFNKAEAALGLGHSRDDEAVKQDEQRKRGPGGRNGHPENGRNRVEEAHGGQADRHEGRDPGAGSRAFGSEPRGPRGWRGVPRGGRRRLRRRRRVPWAASTYHRMRLGDGHRFRKTPPQTQNRGSQRWAVSDSLDADVSHVAVAVAFV